MALDDLDDMVYDATFDPLDKLMVARLPSVGIFVKSCKTTVKTVVFFKKKKLTEISMIIHFEWTSTQPLPFQLFLHPPSTTFHTQLWVPCLRPTESI